MRCGWSTPRSGRFTPRKDQVLIVQEAGWATSAGLDGCGKSCHHTGIRSPARPARRESLYRLCYPGPTQIANKELYIWGETIHKTIHKIMRKTIQKIIHKTIHEIIQKIHNTKNIAQNNTQTIYKIIHNTIHKIIHKIIHKTIHKTIQKTIQKQYTK
jgi:hypothetical protein